MTLQEHIDHVKRTVAEIQRVERPIYLASQSAIAKMSDRIFVKGQSASGGSFTYNSTNPLYVNPLKTFGNTSKLKPPRGKTGKTKFASTGKPHKTTWVESYKALRSAVGRESNFVNWEASGSLKFEIETGKPPQIGKDNTGANVITPIKVNDNEFKVAVRSNENTGKLDGLMGKYPGVFELSETERNLYVRVFNSEFLRSLKERFQ